MKKGSGAITAAALSVTAVPDPNADTTHRPDPDAPLQGLLAHILSEMDGADSDLKTVIQSLGQRAFGPVMVLCGLFMMTPLGALPGVPGAFGLVNIAFAAQLLLRRPYPFVPNILHRVRVPHDKVSLVDRKVGPWLARIDNVIRPRLFVMTRGPMLVLCALVSILLSAAMVPLGLVPFGVVPVAAILGLMGLSLVARDGLLMIIALTLSGVVFIWAPLEIYSRLVTG